MNDFKWRHFQAAVILPCVRWYYKYTITKGYLEQLGWPIRTIIELHPLGQTLCWEKITGFVVPESKKGNRA